jgi:excisionase family DNA binding protein
MPPAGPNGPVSEVFTLEEAAAYLRLPEEDVLRMFHEQGLPARQVGTEWRFLKAAVQRWLGTGTPPLQSNKQAWMALAGAWKDDPYVEEELNEIYRQRGRPTTEAEA